VFKDIPKDSTIHILPGNLLVLGCYKHVRYPNTPIHVCDDYIGYQGDPKSDEDSDSSFV